MNRFAIKENQYCIAVFFRGIYQWRETVQENEIELITDWELAHKQEEGLLR